MREPPKLYRPVPGGSMHGELQRVLSSISAAMEWIAEAVAEVQKRVNEGTQNPEIRLHQGESGRDCPACTPEQPCERVRTLMGQG